MEQIMHKHLNGKIRIVKTKRGKEQRDYYGNAQIIKHIKQRAMNQFIYVLVGLLSLISLRVYPGRAPKCASNRSSLQRFNDIDCLKQQLVHLQPAATTTKFVSIQFFIQPSKFQNGKIYYKPKSYIQLIHTLQVPMHI